jgi:putative nucleotidyltransferase with HDIG domain
MVFSIRNSISSSSTSTDNPVQDNSIYSEQPNSQLERLGPLLVQCIFSSCKTVHIYDSNNRAVQVILSRLMHTLRELFDLEKRATLKVSTDLLFINEMRIMVDPQGMTPLLYLIEEMKKRKVEEIDFAPEVSTDELGAFLRIFSSEPTEEDAFGELNHKLIKAGIENIRLTEWIERVKYLKEARVERREIREESNRVMSRAILFMAEVMRSIEQRRPIQLPKAHRLIQQIADIVQTDESILVGLASLKDYDEYTFSHSVNVSVLSVLIAERMGLSKSAVSRIGVAALFHDIGKTHIPKSILNKPSELTSEEWSTMERHAMLGVIELSRVRSLRTVIDPIFACLQHHLLFNLEGYPQKPGSWELHPFIDIITIADVFDAMTTPRIYRKNPMTPDRALRFILAKSGKLFNPLIAQVFIKGMGVYPIGTVVELDSGEKGVVVKQNDQTSLMHRPVVVLLDDKDGSGGEPVDLAEQVDNDTGYRRTIVNTIHNTEYEVQKAACFIQR